LDYVKLLKELEKVVSFWFCLLVLRWVSVYEVCLVLDK
jgi:hypothetical protein